MTLESTYSPKTYISDGIQKTFPIPFIAFAPAHVCVTWYEKTYRHDLQYGQDYTVTLFDLGGSVILKNPLPSGIKLTVHLEMEHFQPVQVQPYGELPAQAIERQLDTHTLADQLFAEQLGRSLLIPLGYEQGPEAFMETLFAARDEAVAKAGEAGQSAESANVDAVFCGEALEEVLTRKKDALTAIATDKAEALANLAQTEAESTARMVAEVEEVGAVQIALATEQAEIATRQATIATEAATRIEDVLDIEGISSAVDLDSTTFIATSRAVKTAYDTAFMATFPGVVVAYGGGFMPDGFTPKHADTGQAMSGWRLCNGEGGTPDLRGRFILGADLVSAGEAGGSAEHTHQINGSVDNTAAGGMVQNTTPGNVGVTTLSWNEMPVHAHNMGTYTQNGSPGQWSNCVDGGTINTTAIKTSGSSWGHSHTSPAHAHNFTPTQHGHTFSSTTETLNQYQPYYSLCYIMRLPQEIAA